MPRNARGRLGDFAMAIAAGALAGCFFDAGYQSGQTTCNDGQCPTGMVCNASHVCVTPGHDAAIVDGSSSAGSDAADAHVAALNCAEPGELTSGTPATGTIVAGHANNVDAMCDGSFTNGADAVYAIAITAAQSLDISLAGSDALVAYVVASCEGLPDNPACIGSAYTTPTSSPVVASPGSAGTYFVIVDSVLATGSGAYSLTVTAD
jgi:hypothetical protein